MYIFNIFGTVNKFLSVVLVVVIVLLSPFYLYSSGLPQPSHILMLSACISLLFINRVQVIYFFKNNMPGLLFIILILTINFIYALLYKNFSFVVNSGYWLFNFCLFIALYIVIRKYAIPNWIPVLIAIKYSIIIFSYLIGWGGYEFWPRYDYFFNGPNQLAYFALCLFLVYIVVTRFEINLLFFAVYSMLFLIVLSSGGRSAYLALIPVVAILIFRLWRQFASISLIILIPFVVNLGITYFELPNVSRDEISRVKNVAENTLTRLNNLTFDVDSGIDSIYLQLSARGYLRAVEHPWYLLYGAGQGYDDRFIDEYGYIYEIHSSIFAVFFYYGIFGLVLFLCFLWRAFEFKINILLMSPIFVYGLFTYGLRSPYFWLALAFLSTAPNLFELTKSSISNHRN